MNRHSVLSALFIAFFIFFSCFFAHGAEQSAERPDILIKISRLNQAINIIDKMAAADMDQPAAAPSFLIRSMLYGTDWIDPARSIVIGINFKDMAPDAKPVMAALIPYTRQNEDFHISYGAVSKIDHYIIPLPPGEGGVVSDQMAYDLAQASLKKPEGLLSMEVAASRLLTKADTQIQDMLLKLDSQLEAQDASAGNLSSKDVNHFMKNLINAAKQLDTFSMGIDLTESELTVFSNFLALKKTDLAKLFIRTPESNFSLMGKYSTDRHINFRSTSYDINGMVSFFNNTFGEFYKKIGLDLANIESIASHFTGETAGGISLNDSKMDIEMIAVMNDASKTGTEFIQSVYMPWIMNYGRTMAAFYNQQSPGKDIENIFTRTSESTLYGNKVYGVSCKIPKSMMSTMPEAFTVNLRTTAVNNLLLTASNDDRLKQLIKIAGMLEKKPYDGPVMKMDIDLGAYLNAVGEMIPTSGSTMNVNFSPLGSLLYTFDLEKGKLSNKYVIQVDDIRSMVSAFKQAGSASPGTEDQMAYRESPIFSQSAPTMLQQSAGEQKPRPKKEDTADFWLDKGLLYATYGNEKEAIKFYKKALQIEPENPRVLFNLGLSYSSMGNYELAVSVLNQAIFLAPDNGDYYYGLGWAYLLKGESGKAMEYIQTAADLGNPDAEKYLMKNEPLNK